MNEFIFDVFGIIFLFFAMFLTFSTIIFSFYLIIKAIVG